jgi:hypothetical protein
MASGGENGYFKYLFLGLNFYVNHYWDLFEAQSTYQK